MQIVVVAVGKIKEPGLRALIDDYLNRISRYAQVKEIELKDEPADKLTDKIQKAIPSRARVIAMEVTGVQWSSHKLASYLAQCELQSVNGLAFVIGGAYGLPAEVSQSADLKLSLSAMTLPHRLARLILVEQIYRGFSITRNEPYAHE